jgi:aryl-alcohol dehydrogenase-like predicted oxidoreductase
MPKDYAFGIWLTYTVTARTSWANGSNDPASAMTSSWPRSLGLQRQANGRHTFRSDPEYVKAACEQSLRRLGVDTIDLYYCHRVDGVTPIEKTVEAMVELKKSVIQP